MKHKTAGWQFDYVRFGAEHTFFFVIYDNISKQFVVYIIN